MTFPVFWSAAYEVEIGEHVYPTQKYRIVGARLLEEGTLVPSDFQEPSPASEKDLARVHTRAYLEKVREGGFTPREVVILEVPFSPALREAFYVCCGGTLAAARAAPGSGVAVHLGGGFHHAFADHGEGFCLLNDVAVAARTLVERGEVARVAVVDLDVHQGNGTAAIFAGDPAVFTFSMHQERNYPHPKPPSDLDVGLPDGTGDEAYLARLGEHLPAVVEEGRPELVFYLAGADPYRNDQLGGLALTMEGLRGRDELVYGACREAGVPVVLLLAGGYAVRLEDTVEIHCNSVRAARRLYVEPEDGGPEES